MENILRAERDGTVKKVNAKAGDSLAVDAVIMEFAWILNTDPAGRNTRPSRRPGAAFVVDHCVRRLSRWRNGAAYRAGA